MSRASDEDALDLFSSAEPDEPRVWSPSEVNGTVRALLEGSFPALWVAGEVANWTRARSGHCYFTLKDDRAQLRCVMWRPHARRLPVDPEEGMRIRAFGSLTLYEARGEFQIVAREVQGEGEEGLWRLAFEKLRARLEEEGLLDPARRRPIPRHPGTVGVVTSPTGAALRDILSVIRRRAPWTRVLLRGARVQGEGAADEVARAIRELAGSGRVDLVIVGRGGGSIEDLWAFNEEPVARAIAECPVPVISAVGHEVDVTIADLVADLRAPTPSAAAEAAVPDAPAVRELLLSARLRLVGGLRAQLERRQRVVADAKGRIEMGIRRLLEPRWGVLERRTERLFPAFRRLIRDRREHLGRAAAQIEALSPLSTLKRGYAVALSPEGRVLRTTAAFEAGRPFHLRLADGRVDAETTNVHDDGAGTDG